MDNTVDSYSRFLSGDNKGLEEIICAHKDGLMIFLNGFVRDVSVAEELTEETFVKLVVKRPHFSRNSSFKTWLYAIARNIALDHIRHNKIKEISLEDCREISAETESLERAYIKSENRILLHRIMENMKQEYRQVLWLSYFENFSNKEISRIMGKSVHNIETLVYRARLALKTKLLKEGFVYEDL